MHAYTDCQPHTHSTTSMYVSQQNRGPATTPSQTLLQHPAGGGVSPDEKKKVAWCDCDNSPPPFFPRLLLCGEIMETLIRKMQDCGEDLIRRTSHSDSFVATRGNLLGKKQRKIDKISRAFP